jgi:hypothetical protein
MKEGTFEAGLMYGGTGFAGQNARHTIRMIPVEQRGNLYAPGAEMMNVSYLAAALRAGLVLSTKHVNYGLWTRVKQGGGWTSSLKLLRLDCVVLAPGEIE